MKTTRFALLVLISVCLMKTFPAVASVSAQTTDSVIEVTTTMQKSVTAEGVIQKQGITTYQYGTHVLKDGGKTIYALTSKSEKLDAYVGKRVKLTGTLIEDYPVDGGPQYVEVTGVEVIK